MKKILIVVALIVITIAAQAQTKNYEMTIEFDRSTKEYQVILEGSEVGTFYQLFYLDSIKQNVPIGDGVEGTGKTLIFPTTTITEVYIIATSKSGKYDIITPTKKVTRYRREE